MQKFVVLLIYSVLCIGCNDDCIKCENRGANYNRYIEKDSSSIYYNVEILRGFCTYLAEFDSCNSPRAGDKCIKTIRYAIENLINQTIEIKVNISGHGEKSLILNGFETIDITPLPDYCKNRSWGEFLDVIYK
ncbi:MAG: hypothetical protein HOP11_00605 [Saprospiraceae bacterium]|nr:hypothetical protein [Saprospiraceae bacterium]